MAPPSRAFISEALNNRSFRIVETDFVAPEFILREDVAERKQRLARIVSSEIVPRLVQLHTELDDHPEVAHPTDEEIEELARLVMSPNLQEAAAYVTFLRERGLAMETLFVELLQPAAQHLGRMWEDDECDFVDVTLGVGQLQKLLSVFNCTNEISAVSEKRRVLLSNTPGEQHSFGLKMIDKLLSAAGWHVTLETESTIAGVSAKVAKNWYAVAGITLATERRADEMASLVTAIRKKSRNPAIGIMVGGPELTTNPERARAVGADGTAVNATTAVLLTQKLFDIGAGSNWKASKPG